jgi:uncharacterized membrane protein YeaQ/YmgE (transglycosylase-associated protein family)
LAHATQAQALARRAPALEWRRNSVAIPAALFGFADATASAESEVVGVLIMWGVLWIIIVGFIAGIIARWLSPGRNNPTGFILTTLLGIAGAFLATFLGQMIGWYRADQGAGFIAATLGALIVLFIWNRLVVRGAIRDPGNP